MRCRTRSRAMMERGSRRPNNGKIAGKRSSKSWNTTRWAIARRRRETSWVRELQSKQLMDGKATFRLVHLAFGPMRNSASTWRCSFRRIRKRSKRPSRPSCSPRSFPRPAQHPPDRSQTQAAGQRRCAGGRGPFNFTLDDVAKQYAEPLRRGYAIATFYYQQAGADKPDYRQSGFFPAYPDYDWGDLAAWSWAMSRCVDYLETRPSSTRRQLIALGHSRLGKTALVAGGV